MIARLQLVQMDAQAMVFARMMFATVPLDMEDLIVLS